ncbi:Methyltransferase domain-containing protein [Pedococcus dokdonensis]|uniref:Methyltransferase domain-containing protein n=1 Tax=Pedococcus dokdonensis TaxID=443156 RepID=A0A1H0PAR5_9MICO|nr:Methyltransferase domain-containing protein [Pedococcus dokdonensis]
MSEFAQVSRREAGAEETAAANRSWWDAEAGDYYAEHGTFLGDADFVWGPEGWREEELGLLGDLTGRRVLEIGGGAGQCSRWVAAAGGQVVATDLSSGMVKQGLDLNRRADAPGPPVPFAQCDAVQLPFAEGCFDTVFTAYGAVPFVADSARLLREVARVLRPGGRFVFSTTHPFRWAFPDDPGQGGLTVTQSYFDRTPYVEADSDGEATYVEHHRTLGDRVREVVAAGLVLVDVVEPEWPSRNQQAWGGWSPLRGGLFPGTAIFVCTRA